MATTKDYLQFILDQLFDLDWVSYRLMMWEYILYLNWKIIGWIYDNCLLLKPTDIVKEKIKNLEMQVPYLWAKPMIYVDNVDNSDYLKDLITSTYNELYWNKCDNYKLNAVMWYGSLSWQNQVTLTLNKLLADLHWDDVGQIFLIDFILINTIILLPYGSKH